MRQEDEDKNATHTRRPVSVKRNGTVWEVEFQVKSFQKGDGAS